LPCRIFNQNFPVVQSDLGTILSEIGDEHHHVKSEEREGKIIFLGSGENEERQYMIGRLEVFAQEQENKRTEDEC
jgi:hypothetical protein